MWRTLFLSIMHKLSETSSYFSEKYDATGRIVRQLAYGMATDMIDEYLKLGKSNALECLKYYCVSIIKYFGVDFLRRPTVTDTQCLLGRGVWIFRYVREHRLYALTMAQL
jgi:hypothetical protein